MGLPSGHDVEVGVISQVSTCVQRSVSIFNFAGGFHISDSQPMLIDESLADEALSGSAVKEGLTGDLFLCRLQRNQNAHCIACHAGL